MLAEEYLHTMYHPDCDFVDGRLEARNLGENDHSRVQGEIYYYLRGLANSMLLRVFLEQRVRASATRYRVPDICVTLGRDPLPPVLNLAPFICIEVLSTEDRMPRVLRRADDYVALGVPNIWIIDPKERVGYTYSESGLKLTPNNILATVDPEIRLDLAECFASIDAM